jgi:hypothetical protein
MADDDELPLGELIVTLRKTLRDTTQVLEQHGEACQDALASLEQISHVLDATAARIARSEA